MPAISRTLPLVTCLTALLAAGVARPAAAADWRQSYVEPAIQTWMGLVTLLAEDGERAEKQKPEQCDGDCKDGCKDCERKGEKGRRGDKGECKGDCRGECETCRGKGHADHGRRHGGGEQHGQHGDHAGHHGHAGPGHHGGPAHGRMGPPRPEGPRGDALAMLNDIVGRLSRIEAMLAGRGPMPSRGPGAPSAAGRGEWRGRGGPQASPEMRAMMEARMKEGREKMKAAREKWEQASPEEREEMKKQWEARMKEGRERMKAAREKWEKASPEEREEMKKQWQARMKEGREKMEKARAEKGGQSENPDQMRQAMDRVREEGRKRMEEAKAKMEEARKRFQEMEQRVKRLEAEVARMKKAAEKDD
jgi:hypothetical protein